MPDVVSGLHCSPSLLLVFLTESVLRCCAGISDHHRSLLPDFHFPLASSGSRRSRAPVACLRQATGMQVGRICPKQGLANRAPRLSNFRLLLGLTSLDSIRCFCHFFSSGPDGIFESTVVAIRLPDNSKKDCEGNRNVAGENQPSQSLTTNRNKVR